MPKILIIRPQNDNWTRFFPKDSFEIEFCENLEDEIVKKGHDADGIIFAPTKFDEQLFDKLPNLKIISRAGIGIDTVDMDAATKHNVAVCNCANYGVLDVAQHTAAILLSLINSVCLYDKAMKDGTVKNSNISNSQRLSEKKIGIIGFGKISRQVCQMLKGFGAQISVYDPYPNLALAEKLGVNVTSQEEIIRFSDIISLNAPLNEKTYHIINEETIAMMKQGVLIVNTSRGALIDENALTAALENGKVSGCALDVFEKEPLDSSSKLTKFKNVVLTPHVAWRSNEAVRDLIAECSQNIIDFFEGKPVLNRLN